MKLTYRQKINNFVSVKLEKILLKKISPLVGRFLDKIFLTSFSRLGVNFYHYYDRNDYIIDNHNSVCFIHLPKTAGISIRETLKKNGFPLFIFISFIDSYASFYKSYTFYWIFSYCCFCCKHQTFCTLF